MRIKVAGRFGIRTLRLGSVVKVTSSLSHTDYNLIFSFCNEVERAALRLFEQGFGVEVFGGGRGGGALGTQKRGK